MDIFLPSLLIVVGIALLVKGGDWLVDGASKLARGIGMSDLLIGLTIVAFGTSMPEFIVSFLAGLEGTPDVSLGNVIGSNIANILLILGIAAVIYPLTAPSSTTWREIPFMLLASVVLVIQANDRFLDGAPGSISRTDGLALCGLFLIFLYSMSQLMVAGNGAPDSAVPRRTDWGAVLWVVLGLGLLIGGGQLVVTNAVILARTFGVAEYVIGATIVAVGTSLPELATSAMAAYRKNSDIAIGNVVGSNIFNILFILGVNSVILPLPVHDLVISDGIIMLAVTFLLFFGMFIGGSRHQIQRWQGALFLFLYVGYIVWLLIRAGT
ncbi:MAG: calcium/sodium antiporter [Candidatus Hydrogenedentales bacterium]